MAKLSSRYDRLCLGADTEYITNNVTEDTCLYSMKEQFLKSDSQINKTQENTNMNNTLQEITATLIDNNPHLEDDQRIVFQEKGIVTSASNEDIKLDLIAKGKVMPALNKHNEEVRATTVREDILENTGREVMLKPIKKLSDSQLEWRFVATA